MIKKQMGIQFSEPEAELLKLLADIDGISIAQYVREATYAKMNVPSVGGDKIISILIDHLKYADVIQKAKEEELKLVQGVQGVQVKAAKQGKRSVGVVESENQVVKK
jgi:GAF domain-containing protein